MGKIKRTFGFIYNHPLGRKHLAQCISRFLIWQFQTSLSPKKFFVKKFIGPVKFYARKGLTGITGNIYTGLHEFNDMGFLLHFLRPDDVFFDIGANAGSYTLLASGVCGTKSTAIEPVKSTFDILSMNVDLNKINSKVTVINAAVGATEGTISFTSDQDTTNHVISENENGYNTTNIVKVPVITIDSLIKNNSPSLIKIDVEGYETEALKGMADTLNQVSLKAIIIELNGSGARYGYDEKDIHELLLSKKFNPYNYDPFKRSLTAASTYNDLNTIYCRDIDFINDRLKNAGSITIMGEAI